MNKFKMPKVIKTVGGCLDKHAPEILFGIGVTGMISTTILAVKETPKALELLEEARQADAHFVNSEDNKLPIKTVIKTTWKCYIPAVTTGAVSLICLFGSKSINAKRNAVLATAYKLSETTFREYKDKVIETFGEDQEKIVHEKVAQKHLDENPIGKREVIFTGKGDILCYDVISGRYFRSNKHTIENAEIYLNKRMISGEEYISLSELYDALGLSHTKQSDEIGWNLHRDGTIEINFSSMMSDEDEPCLVLDYAVAPRYDFSTLY